MDTFELFDDIEYELGMRPARSTGRSVAVRISRVSMTVVQRVWNYSQIQERVRHREKCGSVRFVMIGTAEWTHQWRAESKAGGRD